MNYPKNLKYSKDHEWITTESTQKAKVGVSAYAVDQLGDIVHMDLPAIGTSFKSGDSFGTIESTKTVSDLYMPVSGKIVARNETLLKAPEALQKNSYDQGWLVEIEVTEPSQIKELLSSDDYVKLVNEG